ncbi:protein BNIP5 isoform X2 [Castor canadensis]|uniref:Protein BNIP5 isoform X2 n=1 Tax=Castor canadensis TaxID=51338 RepID=A0A8B7UXW3_CASCN
MEHLKGPQKPLADRRAQSVDRSQVPRKDSEAGNCQCLSLPTTTCKRTLCRVASDGAKYPASPSQSAEAQSTSASALTLEETRQCPPSEQSPSEDIKKDKAQRRAQQGWLKTILNFLLLLRTGPEEPREKAIRRPKGKEEPLEPPEAAEEPALRKKAQERKASRKKHGHRKHGAEDTEGPQHQEARGQEAGLPEEADLGPTHRGGQDSNLHQFLPFQGRNAGLSDTPPQAAGPLPEEELKKPDEDAVILMIVELLKKVGDQWEEEQLQAPQPEVAPQNPAVALGRKSQEKKPSLKRVFSLKKLSPEEPKRASSSEARSPRRPGLLCVGGHRPSISNSLGSEEPGVHETLPGHGEVPSPLELPTQARCQGLEEELLLDGVPESREFMQKILALLRDAEEQEGEQQPQVQEAEAAVENLAPVCRKKSQEKKSSLRRAFSHKKYGSKELKRGYTADASNTEVRPPKRPSFLPLCVGGQRPSISSCSGPEGLECWQPSAAEGGPLGFSEATPKTRSLASEGRPSLACESKDLIIHELVALLQEVDGELGKQIPRHPSFKRIFYEFSDTSLKKLLSTLRSQKACSSDGDRSLAKRSSPFTFGLVNKLSGSQSRTICSLMGSRGHCDQHNYAQFPQNITSLEGFQSPD